MSRFSGNNSRRAKIVATLGPGSGAPDTIRLLAETGVDVFRLNFSHGDHATHAKIYSYVRKAAEVIDRPLGVLADLQGPKIRVGSFANDGIPLRMDATYKLVAGKLSETDDTIAVPHPEILDAMEVGDVVLVDDGKLQFTIVEAGANKIARADIPGRLTNKKGFTVLGKTIPVPALTEKDREDLEFACGLGADFIALSFVQTRADLEEARALMKGRGRLVAKVEKPAAINNLEDIVDASDAIMVARGDLGVEFPPEQVPILQRRVVRASRAAGKPVIVATHMLESMIESASPTRAEASDVATAVYQGADAVMLSGETAVGRHPSTAVAIMDRIIRTVESDKDYHRSLISFGAENPEPQVSEDVFARAVGDLASLEDCNGILVSTAHYSVLTRIARARPETRLIAHTQDATKLGHMALVWGVEPLATGGALSRDELLSITRKQLDGQSGKLACAIQDKDESGHMRWHFEILDL